MLTEVIIGSVICFKQALWQRSCLLSVISSVSFALACFFYVYLLGSFLGIPIFPLYNRVTYFTFFNFHLINSHTDQIIITLAIAIWFGSAAAAAKCKIVGFAGASFYMTIMIIAVLSPSYDVFLTLAVLTFLPIVMALLILDKRLGMGQTDARTALFPKILFNNNKCPNFVVRYLAIIGIITGVLSIIAAAVSADNNNNNLHFNLLLQQPQQGVIEENGVVAIRNYAYEIFLLFSTFSPFLMFLLILCFPVKLMIKSIAKAVAQMGSEKNNNSIDTEESIGNNNGGDAHQYNILPDLRSSFHGKIRPATRTILLTLFAALPVVLTVTPHLPAINPDRQQIGVDTDYYVRWVTALINSKSTQEFIQNAFEIPNNGDRPLTLVFLFIIAELVQGVDLLHNFEYIIPAIFGPALVLVVYFLTRQLLAEQPFNEVAALLAAFLTGISFQILIGIYAGFYANWLALIISYLAFYFLFKFLKTSQTISIIIFSVLMILLLFSHIYTWVVSALVIFTFLSVMLKMNSYPKRNVTVLLLVVISSSAIVVTLTAITEWSYNGGILGAGLDPVDVHQQIGLNQFTLRWDNLERTMHTFVGGQFSNLIILGLGLYWLYRSNWREPSTIFLMIFLSIGIFGFMFGNWEIQTRIFYDVPFQIPAGIGLALILNEARRTAASPLLFLLPICIWLLAMSLRSVFNFYYIAPLE
jgi:hypothetical protein